MGYARRLSFSWLVTVCLFGPAPATAQGPSVLTLLPVEGRTLEMGRTFEGALSSADHRSPDERYLEAWELRGRAGQTVTIDLISDAFDARLYVVGPGLGSTLTDDDGGGGCNARLTFTMLEPGPFRVVASALGERATGVYTIAVSERPGPAPTHGCGEVDPAVLAGLPTDGRTVRLGSSANGQLGSFSASILDGRPAEAWRLEGRAGERVSIVMESPSLDSYLYVVGPGLEGALADDDGAGNLDAMVDFALPTDGPYVVVASALGSDASGPYTLRVEEALDLGTVDTMGRAIAVGSTREGELSASDPVLVDGRRGQAWALEGAAGQSLTIELVSEDFDAFLYLAGPGLLEPLSDDDGAGEFNARISVTLPESGSYRIIVSALGSDAAGVFRLAVSGG